MVNEIKTINLRMVNEVFNIFVKDKQKISKKNGFDLTWEAYFLHLKLNQK